MRLSLSDSIQAAAALATLALAAAAYWQARSAGKQAAAATRQASATERAVEAATEGSREAARARVDTHSPNLVLLPEPPSLSPLLDRHRSGMPQASDLRLLSSHSLHQSEDPTGKEFVFPEAKDWFLWFRERAIIINEGSTTARIRISGEAAFLESATALLPDLGVIPKPPAVGPPDRNEHLLLPGTACLFEWAGGHTLGRWAEAYEHPNPPGPSGRLTLTVTAFGTQGAIDHVYCEARAFPIEPVPGRGSAWRLASDPRFGFTVYPTQRRYPGDTSDPPTPPWSLAPGTAASRSPIR